MKSTCKTYLLTAAAVFMPLFFAACENKEPQATWAPTIPRQEEAKNIPMTPELLQKYKDNLNSYIADITNENNLRARIESHVTPELGPNFGMRPDLSQKIKNRLGRYMKDDIYIVTSHLLGLFQTEGPGNSYLKRIDEIAKKSSTEKAFLKNIKKSRIEEAITAEVDNSFEILFNLQKTHIAMNNLCQGMINEVTVKEKKNAYYSESMADEVDYKCYGWISGPLAKVSNMLAQNNGVLYMDNPGKYKEIQTYLGELLSSKLKEEAKAMLTLLYVPSEYISTKRSRRGFPNQFEYTDEAVNYANKVIAIKMKEGLENYAPLSTAREIARGLVVNKIKVAYTYEERLHKRQGYSKEDAAKKAKREEALRKEQIIRREKAKRQLKNTDQETINVFYKHWADIEKKERQEMEKADPIYTIEEKKLISQNAALEKATGK